MKKIIQYSNYYNKKIILFIISLLLAPPVYSSEIFYEKNPRRNSSNQTSLNFSRSRIQPLIYDHPIFRKEIHFLGIDQPDIITNIKKQFNLYSLESNLQKISSNTLKTLSQQMMASRTFEKVKIIDYCFFSKNKQLIFIYVKPNLYLKKIIVQNSSLLKMKKLFLEKIFFSDINSLLNSKKLTDNLHSLVDWYYDQGYPWIKMKLSYLSNNILNLYISEKRVKEIDIVEEMLLNEQDIDKQVNRKKILMKKIPSNLILKSLNLYSGATLNINSLDSNINNLKEKRILDTCRYEIDSLDYNKNLLKVSLYISSLPDNSTYVLYRNIKLNKKIINELNSLLESSMEYVLGCTYVNKIYTLYDLYKSFIINTSFNESILINRFYYKTCLEPKSFNAFLFALLEWNKWYNFSTLDTIDSGWALRHNLRHLDGKNKSLVFDFSLPFSNNLIEFFYKDPWFLIGNDYAGTFNFHYYSKLVSRNYDMFSKILSLFKEKVLQETDRYVFDSILPYVNQKGFLFQIKHNLLTNFYVEEIFRKNELVRYYFNLTDTQSIFYLNQLRGLVSFTRHFCKIQKALIDDTKRIKIIFSYDASYDLNWVTRGTSLNFQIFNIYMSNYVNYPYYSGIKKTLINHFSFHQFIYLPLISDNFFNTKNFLILNIDLKHFFDDLIRYIEKDDHNNKLPEYQSAEYFTENIIYYKIRFEYHKKIKSLLSFFVSLTYKYIPSSIKISSSSKRFSLGLGLQIKIPIKKVPPLCITYDILGYADQGINIYFRPKT
uniref:POTRA domain-containing protein n=1 Tax=Flintiella sanguinaria TaxID=101926 RepID=A0A1X9PUM8_9RHOD|nr:hypothetical protein [Flintiella sanguinaria]